MANKYRILRFYSDDRPAKLVKTVATETEAQKHCSMPETKGKLADGTTWFDGYTDR